MFYSPVNQWAYEPVFVSSPHPVNEFMFNVPNQSGEFGIVIKLKDGTEYVIADEDY